MKKLIITLGLWFLVTGLWAQNDEGAKIVPVSQVVQNNKYTIQVGVPYLGQNVNSVERKTTPIDVRFPWNILYLYQTFSEESFDVSKGYFGDKILINWDIRANFNLITTIKIYKRIYTDLGENEYEFVGSVSSSETSYEDKYAEGGVLYEYKVVAEGVSEIEGLYSTYISGIGYRNPTAVVTGNISYKGGNPVKDVIIKASSDGSGINTGSSLLIPATSSIQIEQLTTPISDAATFQAWVKPENAFTNDTGTPINLFKLSNLDTNTIDVTANLLATSKELVISIGGSEYRIKNYYPSGKLNSKGDDILIPITNFNSSFVHFSVVLSDGNVPLLYINGRAITEAYEMEVHEKLVDIDPNYTAPYFDVSIPTQTNILSIGGTPTDWDDFYVGGQQGSYIDEIRVWKAVLESTTIRTDYSRYISGNDSRMVAYLSANEKAGSFAYDLSRSGFNYNKNHGRLWSSTTPISDKVGWSLGTGNYPTADQLGILGVSDINGNYEITSIPYSGTGESFNITPLYGVHQFEPGQQLAFLGEGSEVVNKINFIDKSSFNFKGKVLYDTRGVFKSFVETTPVGDLTDGDEYISSSQIIGEGYNYYETLSDGKISKGEYWYNEITDRYEKYATIYSEGVNIFVDGNIVLDENNLPVSSDTDGVFDISVPIGNHYITIKKDGHEFNYAGRFPAESGTFKEFFEDSDEAVIFVDSTRISLVGKVIGGSVEAAKTIGFGDEGLFEEQTEDENGNPKTITVSSKNNIGIAGIKLGYIPPGSSESELETEFNFTTNSESGEYRVSVMPLKYQIDQGNGIIVKNTLDNINLLDANENVDVSKVGAVIIPQHENSDGSFTFGEPYHYEKSFTHRTTPVLSVFSQSSEATVEIDDEIISTQGFLYPVYHQFGNYEIKLKSFERYTNYDGDEDIEDIVPIIDGEFKPTNNIALVGSESANRDPDDESVIIYKFKGGMPSISAPFTRSLSIKYRINGIDYEAENYIKQGIILGGQSDGSQTFITAAPDVPDIILRDPPGSNSFASIESGETISFTTEGSFNHTVGVSANVSLRLGIQFEAGGGLAGPVIAADFKNSFDLGVQSSISSSDGNSLTKTYSFNQTISTSDDPSYVGSDGDLYIGQSKNYFYGSYDDVQSSIAQIGTSVSFQLTNSNGQSIFISKQKAMYFVEEPSETFFIHSQKHILETLIPGLELIIYNLENGIISEDDTGVLTKDEYVQQITLWRKIILDNEKSKYLAKNDRSTYRDGLSTLIDEYKGEIVDAMNSNPLPARRLILMDNLNNSTKMAELFDQHFEDNFSFDAGVGEFSKSVETSVLSGKSLEFNLNINESLSTEFGFTLNKAGIVINASIFGEHDFNTSLTEEQETTTTISYTLKDNDIANLLSVDVVNLFDGNGPIFSTIGGVTSCPYEGPELSLFYNHADYDPDAITINELPEDKQEQLSYATQRVEVPLISVEVADISNVPESNNAEYILLLENNSVSETDVYFELIVDNLSNPSNALINIEQNGTVVFVPYGQKVEYALTLGKSISDVYDYEDIKIILKSRCDTNVFDEVLVSAHFVPSCSQVALNAPLNNWVYNTKTAFNVDETINPLQIEIAGFDTSFNSFQKVDLEYRMASSSTWSRLQTYYTNQEFYDEAVLANESEISLIDDAELYFNLDIVGLQFSDGAYELRARSTCTNDTEYISEVITGRVDLTSPQRFGTPLPIDGILGAGEDLRVSFNENIFYNSAISTIEIKGQTNQLPINHSVSLHFEGIANTVVINNPKITSGDFTLEFWMNNNTIAGSADIIKQDGGVNIGINNDELFFTLGGITAKAGIVNDGLYHHYTFTHKNSTGEISMYRDDAEIGGKTGTANVDFTNNSPLVIGGNTFIGNIHELRLWNKTISLETAYAKMYDKLIGNESNLIGYWPMDEGRGEITKDLARFKHAIVNADWDIKPKGTSYEFLGGQYVALDDVGFVQLTNEMDATISFWMKTGTSQEATLFSNGKGDGSDIVQSNGKANKWAINLTSSGMLTFESEGNSYTLTSQSVVDDNWHHVTLLFNRIGSLRTYIDAAPVSSNLIADIGGFSGNKIWLGARGSKDLADIETVDNTFTGKIDEFRLWNTLRNVEQISRDRFNEMDVESIGLVLYVRMNAPDPENGNGPRYFHSAANETVTASLGVLNSGAVNYSNDVPAIKPERDLIKFEVNHLINGDEMILEPVVTDWASLEGQILDITVHRMFDSANNRQQSPITWTTYVKRNEVIWFAEGYNEIVEIVKNTGEEVSFEISIVNKGGKGQPYSINNVPNWLNLSSTSGTLDPDTKVIITATVDKELTPGDYLENLYLQTDFGFDEKLQIKVKVLADEPDWEIDPTDFDYSMNIVGRIKVDGTFSEDAYDKIAAFSNGEVRGSVDLVYLESFQEYYVYLTVYSNNIYGEDIEFSIWDASKATIFEATIDTNTSTTFKENEVLGTLTNPVIFENSDVLVQNISLNKGWTWVSLNVNDSNFSDINALTQGLNLATDDRILSHSSAELETYYNNEFNAEKSTWSGTISANGGLKTTKMYKVNFDFEQTLKIKGIPVDLSTWSFPIKQNWNWLPYPILGNQSINEALAYFDAVDGDVIKSQHLFSIYDPINGWNGTLNYLVAGNGYMIKSSTDQALTYPNYFSKPGNSKSGKVVSNGKQDKNVEGFIKYAENMNAIVQLPEGYNELFVFDNSGVLKGEATNQIVDETALSFITIYGDTSEELVFYIGKGHTKKVTTRTFSFKSNDILGTVANPIVLEEISDNVSVFPNPFENDLTVKVDAAENGEVVIELYNLIGQLMLTKKYEVTRGINLLKLSPRVAAGTYLLQVKTNNGTVAKKIIKK